MKARPANPMKAPIAIPWITGAYPCASTIRLICRAVVPSDTLTPISQRAMRDHVRLDAVQAGHRQYQRQRSQRQGEDGRASQKRMRAGPRTPDRHDREILARGPDGGGDAAHGDLRAAGPPDHRERSNRSLRAELSAHAAPGRHAPSIAMGT
jgi:hypothetical protein